jgi:hypothetical protein
MHVRTYFSERSASFGVAFTSKDSATYSAWTQSTTPTHLPVIASTSSRPLAQSRGFPIPSLSIDLFLLLVRILPAFHREVRARVTRLTIAKLSHFISARQASSELLHTHRLTCILQCRRLYDPLPPVHTRIDKTLRTLLPLSQGTVEALYTFWWRRNVLPNANSEGSCCPSPRTINH